MKNLLIAMALLLTASVSAEQMLISSGSDPAFQSHDPQTQPGYYWGYNVNFDTVADANAIAWDNGLFNFYGFDGAVSEGNMYVFDSAYNGDAASLSQQTFLTIGASTTNGWAFGEFDFLVNKSYYLYGDAFIEQPLLGANSSTAAAKGFNYAFDAQRYRDDGIEFDGLNSDFYADDLNLVHTFVASAVYDVSEPSPVLSILFGLSLLFFAMKGKSKDEDIMIAMRKNVSQDKHPSDV